MFPQCKSVHKMATGKNDDELLQPDNKLKIGTRSDTEFGIEHDCVVTMHDAYTRLPPCLSVSAHSFFVCVVTSSRTRTVAQVS